MAERLHKGEKVLRGIPVSAGVCRGKILVLDKIGHNVTRRELAEAELAEEVNRLEKALLGTRQQILDVQRKLAGSIGQDQASIFDAHLLVLEDPALIDEAVRVIQTGKAQNYLLVGLVSVSVLLGAFLLLPK